MFAIRTFKPAELPYKVVGSNLQTNTFEIAYTICRTQFKNISIVAVKDWEMLVKHTAVKGNAIVHLREMKVSCKSVIATPFILTPALALHRG